LARRSCSRHEHDEHLAAGQAEGLRREQSRSRGYGTSSQYVRELIRKDQERQHLRALLLDGAASAPTRPADAAYFGDLRDRVRRLRAG
jgi:antitoxin ParD1/3/4